MYNTTSKPFEKWSFVFVAPNSILLIVCDLFAMETHKSSFMLRMSHIQYSHTKKQQNSVQSMMPFDPLALPLIYSFASMRLIFFFQIFIANRPTLLNRCYEYQGKLDIFAT